MSPAILNQSEIDALLAALPNQKQEESVSIPVTAMSNADRAVKVYDFHHPDKFSKEQIRTLEILHDTFARRLSTTLSGFLRTICAVSLVSVEQENYDEFVQRIPIPAVLYVTSFEPLPGLALMEMHLNVAFIVVDRLLGGFGRSLAKLRELSEVEQTILASITREILSGIREAWSQIITVSPMIHQTASSPQLLQVASGREIVLTITFEVKMMDTTGWIRLCLPYTVLEPIVGQLTAQARFANNRRTLDEEQVTHLKGSLNRVAVPVSAVLGESEVSISELLDLEKGDYIKLDTLANRDIGIRVAGKLRFLAKPGIVGRKLAVMITRVLDSGDENATG